MDEPNILVKTALNEAVQKVNEGMHPTDALKKVANDLDLNPNYIQRTGEALNVALHYKHFKTASDRSTDFEIADIPKVVQDVFTLTTKTASEEISEQFSGFDSNESVFNYNRMLSNPAYKRAFLEISGAPETESSFPTTFRTVYEKAANYVQSLSKQAEHAEVEKIAAELELSSSFSNLCDHFKKDAGYRTSFEEFESQVFSKHGSAAIPYLDLLHKTAAPNEERGIHDAGYIMFEPCKEAMLFDNLLKSAAVYDEAEKVAADAAENLKYESDYLKECHKAMGKQANSNLEEAEDKQDASEEEESEKESDKEPEDPVLVAIKKKASDSSYSIAAKYDKDPVLASAMEKEAFFGGLTSMLSVGNIMSGPVHELASEQVSEAFSHGFKHPESGGHKPNLTLDNMERKLLLQELMLTDPILSKVNPQKVARAFEQLLRLSPEISKEKEVVRAELRAMVASQALSKYDADLMTKLDVGMMKRRLATHEFNAGHPESFRF